jgi:hypothetical protein
VISNPPDDGEIEKFPFLGGEFGNMDITEDIFSQRNVNEYDFDTPSV